MAAGEQLRLSLTGRELNQRLFQIVGGHVDAGFNAVSLEPSCREGYRHVLCGTLAGPTPGGSESAIGPRPTGCPRHRDWSAGLDEEQSDSADGY